MNSMYTVLKMCFVCKNEQACTVYTRIYLQTFDIYEHYLNYLKIIEVQGE